MDKIQYVFKVVSNEKLSLKFLRMRIKADPLLGIKPGQFIHIKVNDRLEPFFRRPFSVYRAKKYIEIFYEAVGLGTQILASKKKGDTIDVLGPLGNEFSMPPKGTKQVVMIAGGIGIAPFMILSDFLKKSAKGGSASGGKKYEQVLLYGGRTRGHVYPMKELKKNGCKVHIATDDGSVGVKGKVSKLFSKIDKNPKTTMIYTCGPTPMMAAVQKYARQHKLPGQAACEEVMACALGACLGCSIKTKSGYKTVCYDGPVFDLQEIIF